MQDQRRDMGGKEKERDNNNTSHNLHVCVDVEPCGDGNDQPAAASIRRERLRLL